MAYLTVQINASKPSVADMNQVLNAGDATRPRSAIQNLINLLLAIESGAQPATVTATSSTVAGTVSGQTGGVTVTLNLA